jgi:methyl-accepting chemotaxis protein
MIHRLIIRPLKTIVKHFSHIAQGRYNEEIEIKNQNEIGLVMAALKSMQIQLGFEIEEKKRKALENLQIKMALDSASTGVMIANNARVIIYANKAVVDIFDNAQADIQKQLPKFSVARLIGTNIDDYHINPIHQAQLLSSLAKTCSTKVNIGGRSMLINVNSVVNKLGQHLGSVAEWQDRTAG